ncbi:MAG: hypothetical protein H8D87_14350 [Deltaproteobacteria bacterium]|uniref:hypothetical protein n=1 Tax=Desulfobacula sp. TaxID=2593537 RepID=UPI0019C35AF9|nr:hypothetical protein [Candidatus Desulfobacula maris]MBL6996753.1 hypothetical protein [Desulfobacula sp.]
MKWLEAIEFRISGTDYKLLESHFEQLLNEVNKEKEQKLILYRQLDLDTDISIHILHNSIKVKNSGSDLGIRIVSALKEFGLVNHNVWVEMDIK